MDVSPFFAQLLLIFLPGILWAQMDRKFAGRGGYRDLEFGLRILLFGLTTYLIEWAILSLLGQGFSLLNVRQTEDLLGTEVLSDILLGCGIALVGGSVWLYIANYKLAARFLRWIGATKRYGDEDVWDFLLNSNDRAVEFDHVRDFERSIVMSGYITAFSELGDVRELALRDVEVYDFDGRLLYEMPNMYIARAKDGIHLEFPYRPTTE